MTTLWAQIEACLNSRSLQPLTDDPSDAIALTPGHFLIGTTLTAIPESSLYEYNSNRLSRWQLLRQMCEHFWYQWSKEYLVTKQTKTKWRQSTRPLQIGDLCLLMDSRCPPTKWPLARMIAVHPGPDQRIRVVTIRLGHTTLTRSVSKLYCCRVPMNHTPDHSQYIVVMAGGFDARKPNASFRNQGGRNV